MARATQGKVAPTREYDGLNTEEEAAQYVEDLRTADPADQQVAVPDDDEVIDARIVDDAARRAAQYITDNGYGESMQTLIMYIAAHAVDTADLNKVVVEQMAARILSASSASEVLDPFQTIKGRNMLNRPLQITGCMFLDSTVDGDGFPWYVTFNVLNPKTGEVEPVTVGGEKLVLKAAGIDMHGGWPQVAMITSEPSRRNPKRTINDLVPAV